MTVTRVYKCAYCADEFTNSAKLGGHVHARHPEAKRTGPLARFLAQPAKHVRRPAPVPKLATDSWPGKP